MEDKDDIIAELETLIDASRRCDTGNLYDAYWAFCPDAEGPEDEHGMGPSQSAAYDAANSRLDGYESPSEFRATIRRLIADIRKRGL